MEPSTSKRKPGGRRTRFPQEAADIMLSYYHNVSTFPNETERVELVKKVKRVAPSCSHYTVYHVYQYFANLRHRAKNGIEPSLPSNGATHAAVVAAAKALDTPRCDETRPSPKAVKRQKQLQMLDGRTAAQDAKCHALRKAVRNPVASVAAEDGEELPPISPVSPRRETTSNDANGGKHPPSQTDADRLHLDQIPTCTTVLSSILSPSTRQDDDEPWARIELPAAEGTGQDDLSSLIPQLPLALARPNAMPHRHSPRACDTAPKSFAELATWLSERRSTVATRLDSAPGG